MGTAQVQGEHWGARAEDWAKANEPAWLPVFETVLDSTRLRPGMRLLDIGCGAGGALAAAQSRGAIVSGVDASENLVAISQRRLPHASIQVGEMEELPFADQSFDVVIGINSFQFAGNTKQALREAKRVCGADGTLTMLTWGRKAECDLLDTVLPPVFALLPAAPQPSSPPLQFAEPGVMEGLLHEAGFAAAASCEVSIPLKFPDGDTAVRAIKAAMTRAVRHAGESEVRTRVAQGIARFTAADGAVVLNNRFRLATARSA